VAGKHVLSPYPSWGLAPKAERITWVGQLTVLPESIRAQARAIDTGRVRLAPDLSVEAVMARIGGVITFGVNEVTPAELADL
jgi:hypothetical protein